MLFGGDLLYDNKNINDIVTITLCIFCAKEKNMDCFFEAAFSHGILHLGGFYNTVPTKDMVTGWNGICLIVINFFPPCC